MIGFKNLSPLYLPSNGSSSISSFVMILRLNTLFEPLFGMNNLRVARIIHIFTPNSGSNRVLNQAEMEKRAYIHELKEWPNFTYSNDKILPLLSQVRLKQGMLLGRMKDIGFEIQSQAVLDTITSDIINNSEIEGEVLDKQEVRNSVASKLGIKLDTKSHVGHYVDGVVDMMMDATQNYTDLLSEERLFGWHNALFPNGYSGKDKLNVAMWRLEGMSVKSGTLGREKVHFVAPAPGLVPNEMAKFIDWFNTNEIDSILKVAIAHLWFEIIHPFDDGNGRIGRALTDMLLARSDMNKQRFYSMTSAILKKKKRYYKVLESSSSYGMDITNWIVWFIETLILAIDDSEAKLEEIFKKARFWDRHKDTRLNKRQKEMINKVLDGHEGLIRTDKWSKVLDCPTRTASRDIGDLVNKGILKPNGQGGRSAAYDLVKE